MGRRSRERRREGRYKVTSYKLQVTSYKLQVTTATLPSSKSSVEADDLQDISYKLHVTSYTATLSSAKSSGGSGLQSYKVTSYKLQVTSHRHLIRSRWWPDMYWTSSSSAHLINSTLIRRQLAFDPRRSSTGPRRAART